MATRTSRQTLHTDGVKTFAAMARRRHHQVTATPREGIGGAQRAPLGDLLVDGHTTVAVLSSHARKRRHVTTMRGKVYEYEYRMVSWMLHSHGVKKPRPDVWVLRCLVGKKAYLFIVPGHRLKGLTVEIMADRLGSHWIHEYRDAWEHLGAV